MRKQDLVREFMAEHGSDGPPVRIAHAPYRISPLGAHTDHQNGLVLGLALEPAVHLAFRVRGDRRVVATSRDFPGKVDFDLGAIGPPDGTFGDYLRGIASVVGTRSPLEHGIDARITGELKPGGISSSAALQIAFLLALADANGLRFDKPEMVRLVVLAERTYAGVQVGVLDPTIILYGEEGKLVYLDCAQGVPRVQKLPATLARFDVLLVDSGVVRDLRSAPYNERVAQCREAARILGSTSEPPMLSEFSVEDLRRRRRFLLPEVARRAEHVLSENKRVKSGLTLLQQGDLRSFGQLMTASGRSMIHHFGAGTPETTEILELLVADAAVLGACLSGAGFGGSLLAFVAPGSTDEIASRVRERLSTRSPESAARVTFTATRIGGGAGVESAGR